MSTNETMVEESVKRTEDDSSTHDEHTNRLLKIQVVMLGRIADRLERLIEIQESLLLEKQDGKPYLRVAQSQYYA
ncbi:MAG: hypothetical protein OXG05_12745 [Gammaproteobacteria bacterium]|nr:hypothetical protein [Gammaproteobacteria bacterium]